MAGHHITTHVVMEGPSGPRQGLRAATTRKATMAHLRDCVRLPVCFPVEAVYAALAEAAARKRTKTRCA